MIDERAIYTAAADAITTDNLAAYDQIRTEHPGMDWAGHDNRAERARRWLEQSSAEPHPITLELMPAPTPARRARRRNAA
jgi:hypothetical protein